MVHRAEGYLFYCWLFVESGYRWVEKTWRTLDTRPIEFIYCLLTTCWGSFLILPGDGFGASKGFAAMSTVAPDWAWGGYALCIGFLRIYGLSQDRTWARLVAALGGGIIWFFTFATILLSSPSTGIPVYGVLSTINFLMFVKICRNMPPKTGATGGGR